MHNTSSATDKVVEDRNLVFELESHFVETKKCWVLLFKFLPHKQCKPCHRASVRLDNEESQVSDSPSLPGSIFDLECNSVMISVCFVKQMGTKGRKYAGMHIDMIKTGGKRLSMSVGVTYEGNLVHLKKNQT